MSSDVKYNVNAGFFDAINEDRTYSAEDMNRPYRRLLSNGVFATPKGEASDDLQVFSGNNGMNVIVSAGNAIIGDKWFENPSDLIITISQNSEVLSRIDSIVAQVDKTQAGRIGNIVYRQGVASINPVHPEINTEENIFELRLADIIISPSCVKITQDLITDCRGSSECPWITSLIQQVDTSTLYAQWQAAYQKYYSDQEKEHDEYFAEFKQTFESWFQEIKGKLSEDEAGRLQLLIDDIQTHLTESDAETDSLQSQIKSLASGSPLVAGSIAEMTDTSRVYVNTMDGHWYTHNGTTWVDGGVYQSTEIADNSITSKKTSFLEDENLNLVDETKVINNKTLNVNTGEVIDSIHQYFVTDFMPVKSGKTYCSSNIYNMCYYDFNKNFVSGFSATSSLSEVTIPDGVAFVRKVGDIGTTLIFTDKNNYLNFTDAIGTLLTNISDLGLKRGISKLIFDIFGISYKKGSNRYDTDNEFIGMLSDIDGTIDESKTSYATSQYILVNPKELLHVNNYGAIVCFYDFNKKFIGSRVNVNPSESEYKVSIPKNVSFIRVTRNTTLTKKCIVCEENIDFENATEFSGLIVEFDFNENYKKETEKIIEENSSRINALDTINGATINFLGDSITVGYNNNNISYVDFLQEMGANVNKYGVSGTSIAKRDSVTNSFVERYATMQDNSDFVVVMGGTNDFALNVPIGTFLSNDETSFYGALNVLIQGLIQKYTTSKIFFVTELDRNYMNNGTSNYIDYLKAIKETCRYYSIPVLDLNASLGFNAKNEAQKEFFIPDGLHPNNEGHKIIANRIKKFIEFTL